MGVFDIFSKRQKILRGEIPDVYTYDQIPMPLKVQIVHIWTGTLGTEIEAQDRTFQANRAYSFIVEILHKEYGVFQLPGADFRDSPHNELIHFFLKESDVERVLDAVELSFRVIDIMTRKHAYLYRSNGSELADAAIEELNTRFREHAVGYAFESGEIIRVDSQFLHAEAVTAALKLLADPKYAGAEKEFLTEIGRAHV